MSDLIAIAYDDVAPAQQVAGNVAEMQKAQLIELDDETEARLGEALATAGH
jgi:uncharacterized membrane protein